MNFAKAIFALALCFLSGSAFALTKEVTIDRSNYSLPLTQVKISNESTKWSMFQSYRANSVGLFYLEKDDAISLLKTSEIAKGYYSEIIKSGRCPTGKIKSGRFGRLNSNSNSIDFEVVCDNNNIMVQYVMSDEFAINIVFYKVEWQDINKLAKSVLKHYQ